MANVIFKQLPKSEINTTPITDGNVFFNTTDEDILIDLNGVRRRYAGGNLSKSDVVDNLTTNIGNVPLSAKQGKILNDTKQANINGGASTITSTNLTANRALVSNGSGKVAVSNVTATELALLSGATTTLKSVKDDVDNNYDLLSDDITELDNNVKSLLRCRTIAPFGTPTKTLNYNQYYDSNVDISMSGYTPIAVIGHSFVGSDSLDMVHINSSYVDINNRLYVSSVTVDNTNIHTGSTSATFRVNILYIKSGYFDN